jgi:hypothetical protein
MPCRNRLGRREISCWACGSIAEDDIIQAWENAKRDAANISERDRRIFDNNKALRKLAGLEE